MATPSDSAPVFSTVPARQHTDAVRPRGDTPDRPSRLAPPDEILPSSLHEDLSAGVLEEQPDGQETGVKALPGDPSSVALFLSAMGGLGVWQIGRSARHIRFGSLPAWYHSGATQIGHVCPVEPNFAPPALSCFDQPVGEGGTWRYRRDPRQHLWKSQHAPPSVIPRGPPHLS